MYNWFINIDLSKNKDEVVKDIISFTETKLFTKFPLLKENSTILIAGSLATNTFDENSDIDLHIIRSENIQKEKLAELKAYKKELKDSRSAIELRFARTYEVLEEYLNWNDDYILGEFQSAIVIHDADKRFEKLMKKFSWYPNDIYESKTKWLLSEMMLITEKELEKGFNWDNYYYVSVLTTKYLGLLLTLVRILNRKYPIYDKKLHIKTIPLIESTDIKNLINNLVEDGFNKDKLVKMKEANRLFLNKINSALELELSAEELLTFSTKHKILFE